MSKLLIFYIIFNILFLFIIFIYLNGVVIVISLDTLVPNELTDIALYVYRVCGVVVISMK